MKVRDQIKQMAQNNRQQQFESVVQAYKFFLKQFATACEELVKDQDVTMTDARRELAEWSEFLKPLVAETADGKVAFQLKGKLQTALTEKIQNVNQTNGPESQLGNDSKAQVAPVAQATIGRVKSN